MEIVKENNLLNSINDEFKKNVADSIVEAIGIDLTLAQKSLKTKTKNYNSTLIWDLINTNLDQKIDCDCFVQKRGFWQFIIMQDKQTKHLYTFIREDRLKTIKHDNTRETPHYIEALALLNNDLQPQFHQLSLPDIQNTKFEKKILLDMLDQLCQNLLQKNSNYKHIIISFISSKSNLLSLKANIFNSNLELIEDESWNDYINPDYEEVENEEETNTYENNVIKLPLKQKALDKIKKENIPELKLNDESEKSDGEN